ncbi:squalene epoxidase-domain-containing protein [Zopfochytrium polystomum]|nr:squalene epoxidase-domain-containing protein [Zopfochytrium polystomum]
MAPHGEMAAPASTTATAAARAAKRAAEAAARPATKAPATVAAAAPPNTPPTAPKAINTHTTTTTTASAEPRSQSADVVIVGAGVAGCALAHALASDGRSVLLIERDWGRPDRIVGELMQPGGIRALQKLGLEHCVEDIDAVACKGYHVFHEDRNVWLPYRKDKSPSEGVSFHHGGFIMNLRKAARKCKNVRTIEGTVCEFVKADNSDKVIGVTYTAKQGEKVITHTAYGGLTFVADGCFSKFRKYITNKEVKIRSHFVGFVLTDCNLPAPNHGHVVLAKPSPVLLYQIGTRDTRILVDVPGKLPSQGNGDLKRYMENVVGPQLPDSCKKSFFSALETERLRVMPNSYLPASVNKKEGVVLVGDAMNMRHPLTGGGMTVGLWDVVHIRELLSPKNVRNLGDGKAVLRQMKKLYWQRKSLSAVVNILAQALYDLFSAGEDANLRVLQEACFAYFERGGLCVQTPVGLLSGVIPEPMTLMGHFFSVALLGMYNLVRESSLLMLPWALWRAIVVLYTAIVVFMPLLVNELR